MPHLWRYLPAYGVSTQLTIYMKQGGHTDVDCAIEAKSKNTVIILKVYCFVHLYHDII